MKQSSHSRMTLRWAILLMGILTCSLQTAWSGDRLAIDFSATDLQGQTFRGIELKGKIVLLDFWAVWCAPCVEAIPTLTRLNDEFRREDFRVIGVAMYSGTAEDVRGFLDDHQAGYTVVVGEEELAERYQIIGYPTYFLIGADGAIYRKFVGSIEANYAEVKGAIVDLQKKKER